MAYILKNTSGLVNTRITDTGRQKISQGNFKIAYFQIGDSEVCYTCTNGYNIGNNNILEPSFNSQNSVGIPQSNKQYVKYPLYVDQIGASTYGIPYNESRSEPIYNAAAMRGFFTGTSGDYYRLYSSAYTINSNYYVDFTLLNGDNRIYMYYDTLTACGNFTLSPSAGDFLTIYYDTASSCDEVDSSLLTLTYRISSIATAPLGYDVILDRNTPNLTSFSGAARCFIYPKTIDVIYDSYTPISHWYENVYDFDSVCGVDAFDVKIWNMNIPWTESPAGINNSTYIDYNGFGSVSYIGTKEYLGYNSQGGQNIVDIFGNLQPNSFYYNSFDEIVSVTPEEQKSIAILHYTNNTIDLFYGEKLALEPYNPSNPTNTTGQARNLKVTIPWIAWHKASTPTTDGQTFYVDPPGFSVPLFQQYYIQSKVNSNMNNPGIRYYNLWDTNPNSDGYPNKVGKVFPDQKIIVFDDEEIIAAMSYKSNRSWTLPAPRLTLINPYTCPDATPNSQGLLVDQNEYLWVTYRLDDTSVGQYGLHCNYYSVIAGSSIDCGLDRQNIAVRFGDEFPYMTTDYLTPSSTINPFTANSFKIICQKVQGTGRPDPSAWVEIDFTSLLDLDPITGCIIPSGLTATTFQITDVNYNSAPLYNLGNYISLTGIGNTTNPLNFGDEYYFYGMVETDVQATIYEMRYLINLNQNEFLLSSNPTWVAGGGLYMTEIALLDEQKDVLVVSKLQSPVRRSGVQQVLVKFDF